MDELYSSCGEEYLLIETLYYTIRENEYLEKGFIDLQLLYNSQFPNRNKIIFQVISVNGMPDCDGDTNEKLVGMEVEFYYEFSNEDKVLNFFALLDSTVPMAIFHRK